MKEIKENPMLQQAKSTTSKRKDVSERQENHSPDTIELLRIFIIDLNISDIEIQKIM